MEENESTEKLVFLKAIVIVAFALITFGITDIIRSRDIKIQYLQQQVERDRVLLEGIERGANLVK